jgi:RNA polymerase sigma factor (sigma-70 family)
LNPSSKRERFDELFRAHRERSHRLAWRLLGADDPGARDVVQNAFAKAWRVIDGFRDEASLAAWLTRVVVQEAAHHRTARRAGAALPRTPQPRVEGSDPLPGRIRDAAEGLSAGQREVFVLVHLEGHTVVETARLLGETEAVVQRHLHGAFDQLRSELGDLDKNDRDLLETIRTRFRPQPVASWERVAEDIHGRLRTRRHVQAVAIAMATVLGFFAWSRFPEEETAPSVAPSQPGEEVVLLTTLRGSVTTLTGASVAGATVTAGDTTTETQPDGVFEIADVAARDVQVSVRAPGLSTAEARVDPRRPVTLQLLPVTGRGSVDAETGGHVADKKGFSLVVPADSFPGIFGPVDVEWTVLRDAGSLGAAPAPLATEHDLLESFGMVEVRFAQHGAPIELHGTAELTWPLAPHAPFRDGALAGLYSYDREAGVWKAEGAGTVKKGRMHAQVSHFSWWSCDRPIEERGCVAGRLDGPLSSMVYLEGDDALVRVATIPGHDGKFCLDAMPHRSARVFARSRVGRFCYVASDRVVASAAGTSCEIDRSECATVRLSSMEVECPEPTPWRGDRNAPTSTGSD